MQEPTYRRNQDGMMIEITPQAQGKAAAISRLLAQGGTPFKMSGRYKKGPFKGLTVDEATARAEAMWASSPDSIKQKYADRTSGPTTDLAPSERLGSVTGTTPARVTNASLNASLPGETGAQTAARFKANRMAKAGLTPTTPAPMPGRSLEELTKAPAIPAGGVNSVGDGQFIAGKFAGKVPADAPNVNAQIASVAKVAGAGILAGAQSMARPSDYNSTLKPAPIPTINNTPAPGNNSALEKAFPGIQDPNYKAPAPAPPRVMPANQDAAIEQAFPGVQAQVAAARPPVVPPRSAMPTIGTPSRINSLTGLPMGYRPGDSTTGLDQTKVAESNQRVYDAQTAATPAPPKATIAPAPVRYADAREQYQSSQLDPAKAKEMDAVYAGASSLDQAKITAQSLKRAAGLQPRKPLIPDVAPTRPMSFARR